ncbi:hypothetical protein [uncultured Tateyamaria sp.]|uniref:hypothetical protein n=1 Tax=uncultured Tateyamaria sp. TaxID=455651 RepID=UPI0026085F9B|nr:hypothetical protein [uncultured Tateyamaria sp.]
MIRLHFFGAMFSLLFVGPSFAQTTDIQEALGNPYVASALELVELMRSGDVAIDQDDLFAQILTRAEGARNSDLIIESQILSEVYDPTLLEQRFFSLPRVEEWPSISVGARMLVAASIIDVVDQLEEQGVEPSVESMLEAVGPSLYLMLASAADEASVEQPQIDVVSVRRAGVWFFSLGWPFCCAE